jgi:SAM-dependent methyltransferase
MPLSTAETPIRFTRPEGDVLTQSLDAPLYDARMSGREERAYAYDNALAAQRERLRTLEALFDAGTIAELDARGVGRGWRCLEVGAGGGSIALWLADRVAPGGAVVATDLDTTVLDGLSHPNLEVRVHDVLEDDLPDREFDVVHVRLVLGWLADRETALRRLIAALKPGGWLVAEDLDFASAVPDPHMGADLCARFTRIVEAHHAVIAERHGFDPGYGRRLAGDLDGAGLVDTDFRGRASMWRAGEPGGEIWRLSLEQLRDGIVDLELMDAGEADAAVELCTDARFSSLSPVMMAAWGRRPA